MNTRELRDALGRFPTGVCLITVDDPHSGPLALTANSFASVSLEPPLVLWSIQNGSECFREYTECEHFGISVLNSSQEQLSNHYARRTHHRIESPGFAVDARGVPLLQEAVAWFSCRLHALHEGGDHTVIVGQVLEFSSTQANPLVFYQGGYDRVRSADV